MGYFKNEIIANQVELGDRIPEPRPATDHVALTRRQTVDARRAATARMREYERVTRGLVMSGGLIGLILGVLAGVAIGVVYL